MSAAARQVVFSPLGAGDRVAAVRERLEGALVLGLITVGQRLPGEAELASALGVGPMTLREALSQLREEGLIETRRGRGGGSFASVPPGFGNSVRRRRLKAMGAYEIRDLGEEHAAIGGRAAARAAQRADAHETAQLALLVDALADAVTPEGRRRAAGRFHVELAAAAQSVRLTMSEMRLQSEFGDLPWIPDLPDTTAAENFHRQVVADHQAILRAVKVGNERKARLTAERHIQDGIERLLDLHFCLGEE